MLYSGTISNSKVWLEGVVYRSLLCRTDRHLCW